MKITLVQKARNVTECGACNIEITPGLPYQWVKPRYGAKRVRCMRDACRFRHSDLVSNDKLASLYSASEAVEDIIKAEVFDLTELGNQLETSSQEAQEATDEYDDAVSNLEDHFEGTQQLYDMNAAAEAAQAFNDALEEATEAVRELVDTNGKPVDEEGNPADLEATIEKARELAQDALDRLEL
jgi:hypothetical protein